jgi:hypothetical protein
MSANQSRRPEVITGIVAENIELDEIYSFAGAASKSYEFSVSVVGIRAMNNRSCSCRLGLDRYLQPRDCKFLECNQMR